MDQSNIPKPPLNEDIYTALKPIISEEPKVIQAPVAAVVSQQEKIKEKEKSYIKLAVIAVTVFIAVWLFLSYVISPVTVNGISMQPTFYTGNVVLVWEFPKTWATITNSQYIPNRGNIVILKRTPVSGEDLIKRVIGLPGETIEINSGQVVIYNAANPTGFDPDKQFFKQIPNTAGLVITSIGPGRIFVMGDNRGPGASIDSRSSIGTIPSSGIEGKVIVRLYPFNQIKLF
jgi:signal peptidase I